MSGTLLNEIKNVALVSLVLGIIQIVITAVMGYFSLPTVLGTLLGCTVAILNFALMGVILEKCISRKNAGGLASIGYILRMAIIAAAVVWAMKVDYLNYICVVIPFIFPQASIYIINRIRRSRK